MYMNIQHAIATLKRANAALQQKQYMSAEQRKVWMRARRKCKAFIDSCTKPDAKPFHKPTNNQPTLFA